jgi:hypothetical protein
MLAIYLMWLLPLLMIYSKIIKLLRMMSLPNRQRIEILLHNQPSMMILHSLALPACIGLRDDCTNYNVNCFIVYCSGSLAEAISALPEIKAKKAALDMHTNIATTALNAIRARDIDALCTIEQDMLKQASLDKKQFLQFIGPSGKGCVTDKLRTVLIYYLTTENVSDSDMKEYLDAIQESARPSTAAAPSTTTAGSDSKTPAPTPATPAAAPAVDLAALKYLKEWKMLHKMSQDPHAAMMGARPGAKKASGGFLDSIVNAVGAHGSGLMSQVRTFLPAERDLPVTKVVELIMNNRYCIQAHHIVSYHASYQCLLFVCLLMNV